MIGLDINVLVRYIMQDDAAQSVRANTLLEALTTDTPGWVAMVSVVELAWVLSKSYALNRRQTADAIESLLRTKELVVERAEVVWQALRAFRSANADFADCLIARCAHAAGCEQTLTFDRAAAKHAGMTLA